MTVARSKRLLVVLNLQQQELDKVSQQLSQHQDQLQQEQTKLTELESYRNDYLNSIRALKHADVQQIQRQRNFVLRMQMACDQQGAMVDKVDEHCQAIMNLWQQQSQKLGKLNELIERYKKEEQAVVDQQEQKLIDELSTQKAAKNISII